MQIESNEDGWITAVPPDILTPDVVERLRRDGPTDEALRWVAYLYRFALVMEEPPTATVERMLELPRSTAGRWVALARQRGFLEQSEGSGKAAG